MSSISVIAIRGSHLEKTSQLFTPFGYIDLHHDKTFSSAQDCATYICDDYTRLSKNHIALRGVWEDNGWTVIFDPELVDMADEKALCTISKTFNTEVFSFVIQTTSGTFGFAKYNLEKTRYFHYSDGELSETGTPLPEEEGLNINEDIFIDDLVKLAARFGIDLKLNGSNTNFMSKELDCDNIRMEFAGTNALADNSWRYAKETPYKAQSIAPSNPSKVLRIGLIGFSGTIGLAILLRIIFGISTIYIAPFALPWGVVVIFGAFTQQNTRRKK